MQATIRRALVPLFLGLCAVDSSAQLNNQWATFVKDVNRLLNPDASPAMHVITDVKDKDYAYGDLDRDGWIDLVVARKNAGNASGMFTNQLLMNNGGVLVDGTAQFATASDVVGDSGFATPTGSTDVAVVDVDGDSWPDVVISAAYGNGAPKWISHPRVYHNLGSIGGVWQGLRFESARIPQIFTASGTPASPYFTSLSVGDVTNDGYPDLYFGGINGITDVNDRLLINDGSGYFTDSGDTRMSATMLESTCGHSSRILDFNGDGLLDVMRANASGGPNGIYIAYNNPAAVGSFFDYHLMPGPYSSYHVDAGDLNRDGKPDLVVGDDAQDHVRFNFGNDVAGFAVIGLKRPYSFVTGVDDGFSGNTRIADLDGDGWPETIHADVDIEIPSCSLRCHIYHNLGGVIGSEVVLREEAQMAGSSGWKGAVGLLDNELRGTYDVAVFDLDNDGDLDLIFGRCSGTTVFINQLLQPALVVCSGDGSATACPCGNASAVGLGAGCLNSINLGGTLRASGAARVTADGLSLLATQVPNGPGLYFQGTDFMNGGAGITFGDGLLCAGGTIVRLGVVFASGNASQYPSTVGQLGVSSQGGTAPGDSRSYQVWYRDADLTFCSSSVFNLTNAISLTWQN